MISESILLFNRFKPNYLKVIDYNGDAVVGGVDYYQGFKLKLSANIKINDSNLIYYYIVYLGSEKIFETPCKYVNSNIGLFEDIVDIPPCLFLPNNTYTFYLAVSIRNVKYVVNPYDDYICVSVPFFTKKNIL